MSMTKQNIVYVSSGDADDEKEGRVVRDPNGYLSSFKVPLDYPLANVTGIDIISISIPNTINPVNDYNNKFLVDLGVGGISMIELTPSFYTPTNLQDEINKQFTESKDIDGNIQCVYDSAENRYIFTSKGPVNAYNFIFESNTRAWELLGFDKGDWPRVDLNFASVAKVIRAPKDPKMGLSYIYMTSNIPTNTYTTLKRKRYNILAKMDLVENAKVNSLLTYDVTNLGVVSYETKIDYLDLLEFQFTDFLGRPVLFYDIPNVEISMKLVIWSDPK